tara:strand:+ start:416 stop:2581 length:2166 start_codon:yes stop_codon:yes gene_type:complete
MGGDTNITQPSQPSYGEGLSEALQAQVGLLTGTGDFAGTGSLESLLPLEESIRRKTAQADTDILRQTLLGGEEGGQTQEVTYDDQGRAISGYTEPGEAKIRTVIEDSNGNIIRNAGDPNVVSDAQRVRVEFVDANGNVIDQSDDLPITSETLEKFSDGTLVEGPLQDRLSSTLTNLTDQLISNLENNPDFDQEILDKIKTERSSIPGFDQKTMMGSEGFDGYGLNKNQNSYAISDAQPIFAKDTEGNIIQDATKAGTTETTTLPTFRTGDGMVDILGDKRGVRDTVLAKDFKQYVENNPDLQQDFLNRRKQGDTRTIEEYGQDHYEKMGEAEGRELPTSYQQSDAGRQAGFASAEDGGGFLGLSALAEDLQAGNLSRQRERDLLDVARLSGTYQDIMEDYKPGTQEALADARGVLQAQKENLTGAGAIDLPTDSTFAGVEDVTVAAPNELSASTAFNRQLGLEDGTLRSDILSDAQTALKQGLTPREERQIAEAARARSTLMGRTFDQSGAIAEAEARVAEDNARRMQNRAFAQSVLGQEAGLQQGDITRGMAQESEQAGLQQQVNMTQADVDMRAALANQAQQQQAGQFQQATTADAQRLNEQLKQSGTLGYIDAATRLAALEDQSTLDPFQAVLGRGGGQSLQAGQSVFGQAGYGLNSGPQYLNPEAGLGYIQNQAANAASMYNAQVGAEAAKTAGLYSGLGSLGGGLLGNLNVGPFGG